MNQKPKYEVGNIVTKWTGNYGGPGIIRGIANDDGQPLRYLVGHQIEGGFGEFYHVYAEGNLREADPDAGLPSAEDVRGILRQEPGELVDALAEAHRQVDHLMAQLILLDKTFMPSQSPLWPDIVKRVKLLQKHGATP